MKNFKSFLIKLGAIVAIILGFGGTATYVTYKSDIQMAIDIVNWMNVKAETLLGIGIPTIAVTIIGFFGRFLFLAFKENSAKVISQNTLVVQNVLDRQDIIEQMLNSVIQLLNKSNNSDTYSKELQMVSVKYQLLIASEKLDSVVISDEKKEQIKEWMLDTKSKIHELSTSVLSQNTELMSISEVDNFVEKGNEIIQTVNSVLDIARGRI